jgi:hypothetical protein
VKIILTILLCLITFICFNLGMDYINFGYGLHPAIAFTVVGACAVTLFNIVGHAFD